MCFAHYYSVNQLIDLRFILGKYCRISIDPNESIVSVVKLFNRYKSYLDSNEGIDIEFPNYKINFDSNDTK